MGSKSVYVDVDIDLDDFYDDELLRELRRRGVNVYSSIRELQEGTDEKLAIIDCGNEAVFTDSIKQILWEFDTAKVQIIQRLINDSYHKSFLEAV